MLDFQIDPDIRHAQTPPASFYTDPEIFNQLKQNAFHRSWQFLADADVIKAPGNVHPCNFLEGAIDEPLLLTRDHNDQIHCLANVCTHRGNIVCEGPGTEKNLRCRYHGRRFDLDGKFLSMPEFEGVTNFPSPSDDLPKVSLANWSRLLFASLNPIAPLEQFFQPMITRLAHLPIDQFQPDPTRHREYTIRANWALYIDNYLEGFHIPYIHASLNDAIEYDTYTTELLPHGVVQIGHAEKNSDTFDAPNQNIAAFYYWFFPNLMFNFYPWGLSVNIVRPIAVDLTKVSFLTYIWKREKLDRGAGAGLDRVEREDESIVEATHRGLKSSLYTRGRYSPARETGPHHFHRLALAALNSA